MGVGAGNRLPLERPDRKGATWSLSPSLFSRPSQRCWNVPVILGGLCWTQWAQGPGLKAFLRCVCTPVRSWRSPAYGNTFPQAIRKVLGQKIPFGGRPRFDQLSRQFPIDRLVQPHRNSGSGATLSKSFLDVNWSPICWWYWSFRRPRVFCGAIGLWRPLDSTFQREYCSYPFKNLQRPCHQRTKLMARQTADLNSCLRSILAQGVSASIP